MAAVDEVPLLVRVLAGNSVTSLTVMACLDTADTTPVRRLHPAVAVVAARVPWADMGTAVVDAVRWRAALPAAIGARLSQHPAGGSLGPPALAALAGITHLDLRNCKFVTDMVLLRLPPSLRTLNVRSCSGMSERTSFEHLAALATLDCSWTRVLDGGAAGLPVSLQELEIEGATLPADASLAHLTRLRLLRNARLDAVTVASLPPSLLELHAAVRHGLPRGALFSHLHALLTLDASGTDIDNVSLASMPPSLVSLFACDCKNLTRAAVLPPLPALQLLDACGANIGDALVASLPVGLTELRVAGCRCVTARATLDHVPALQSLHSLGTDLAPSVLAGCRARGCAVPAAGVLRGHSIDLQSLAPLGDGRLASADDTGEVRVWDLAAGGGEVVAALRASGCVVALASLQNGHRLAAGMSRGCIEIWEVGVVPFVRTLTIACGSGGVGALAALHDGRLAAGSYDGKVLIVDADASAVTATLEGHTASVTVLVALPDGTLASGSDDSTVRLWDVSARACVAALAGHGGGIHALAVLADGRLASGAGDHTVRLWDVGARSCAGVLAGHISTVSALAALPDGRLASGSWDGSVRMWDTRPAAAATASRAAGAAPMTAFAQGMFAPFALVPLPDGRFASASGWSEGAVYLFHVPPPAPYEALDSE